MKIQKMEQNNTGFVNMGFRSENLWWNYVTCHESNQNFVKTKKEIKKHKN